MKQLNELKARVSSSDIQNLKDRYAFLMSIISDEPSDEINKNKNANKVAKNKKKNG